jgi:hypothetical protein
MLQNVFLTIDWRISMMIPGPENSNHNHYTLSTFLPLIIIFSIIFILTVIMQMRTGWHFYSFLSTFMGIFFIVFGAFKIFNLTNFAHAFSMYDLIAKQSRIYALSYPFIELGLGILYLGQWFPRATNIITLIIMLISAAGVGIELSKGAHITCACLGTVFKIPMTYVTLLEDLLMAVMAVVMLFI